MYYLNPGLNYMEDMMIVSTQLLQFREIYMIMTMIMIVMKIIKLDHSED
jgi:hypothetical protein